MYDYVIVTHIPAFYKVNLYNEIAKEISIFVVFIASDTAEKRADDFIVLESIQFDYDVLHDGNFQDRDVAQNINKLKQILKPLLFKRLLVSGWDLKEFWYLVFTNIKLKNCLALESTIVESSPKGLKGLVKKIFLSRISTVFASGKLHIELLKALNYKGGIKITKGVGIINKPSSNPIKKEYKKRFLYIGRLSKVKNLAMLIDVFNDLPDYSLTIIGDGEEKQFIKNIAKSNIVFKNQVENKNLKDEFLNNDMFILLSISESWGLVLEEALYFGLPVIVSENCGASELISDGENGFTVNPYDKNEIKNSILKINNEVYSRLAKGAEEVGINKKDIEQVSSYI